MTYKVLIHSEDWKIETIHCDTLGDAQDIARDERCKQYDRLGEVAYYESDCCVIIEDADGNLLDESENSYEEAN